MINSLINVIYNERLKDIPKILETPYINDKAPYKEDSYLISVIGICLSAIVIALERKK